MADRRYVVVVSPAYVKPIHDGSRVVIIFPGATQEHLEHLRAGLEDLRTKPEQDLHMFQVRPDSIELEFVPLKKVREIRGE